MIHKHDWIFTKTSPNEIINYYYCHCGLLYNDVGGALPDVWEKPENDFSKDLNSAIKQITKKKP